MAVTVQSNWAGDLLINYVTTEIQTLEPDLYFALLGVRRDVPKGYDNLVFPQTNQINATSVGTLTEGQDPTSVTWGSTAYKAGGTQKGLLVQVSDLLVRNSAIEVLEACVRQVKLAVARQIDQFIQTTVEAGTTVSYAGGKSARTSLGSGDLIDTTLYVKGIRALRANNVRPFEGRYYVAIAHPSQVADLMLNTSTGSWIDVGRYTSTQELLEGKMDHFRGARVLESANVQTFSSTVTVYPMLLLGEEAFGWGYFQLPEPILVTTPDSNNPLNVYDSIGAKTTLGAIRFEETRLNRLETAVSA
ncbi:MAG: N4-gp56 family major capsid protein [Patescibacteria group bacterium]|nr:N4-gp56 family major capsid protein [Patescibacteria group bacterium]